MLVLSALSTSDALAKSTGDFTFSKVAESYLVEVMSDDDLVAVFEADSNYRYRLAVSRAGADRLVIEPGFLLPGDEPLGYFGFVQPYAGRVYFSAQSPTGAPSLFAVSNSHVEQVFRPLSPVTLLHWSLGKGEVGLVLGNYNGFPPQRSIRFGFASQMETVIVDANTPVPGNSIPPPGLFHNIEAPGFGQGNLVAFVANAMREGLFVRRGEDPVELLLDERSGIKPAQTLQVVEDTIYFRGTSGLPGEWGIYRWRNEQLETVLDTVTLASMEARSWDWVGAFQVLRSGDLVFNGSVDGKTGVYYVGSEGMEPLTEEGDIFDGAVVTGVRLIQQGRASSTFGFSVRSVFEGEQRERGYVAWPRPHRIPTALVFTGGRHADSSFIADVNAIDGAQNLSTHWWTGGGPDKTWFTVDLGQEHLVSELRIASRADQIVPLEFYVGNTLSGNRVAGATTGGCTLPSGVAVLPSSLAQCEFPERVRGRYITVQGNQTHLKIHGFEVWGSGIGENELPTAAFTTTVQSGPLELMFDGSGSDDTDGTIVSHQWSFGDGTTATGAMPTHTYGAEGRYTVTLTVMDDSGGVERSARDLAVFSASDAIRLPGAVIAAGVNDGRRSRILDEIGSTGLQRLSSSWINDKTRSTGWFTVDLGSVRSIETLKVAPRGDVAYRLSVSIGGELAGGRASGRSLTCTTTGLDTATPTHLQACHVPLWFGRYLTVQSEKNTLRFHGLEVYGR